MALIGIKNKDSKKVEYFEEKKFEEDKSELYLHKIIKDEPKLIFDEITQDPIQIGSEVILASGKRPDLIFCNSSGELFIVELKRGKSPRDALVQLMDYYASIRELTLEQFFKLNVSNLNEIKEKGEIEDEEEFKKNLTKSLKEPRLILVSYEISEDVRRMARLYRDKNVQISCIEFDYYMDEKNNEIFIPKPIGGDEADLNRDKKLSQTQQNHLKLFNKLIEEFKEKKSITDRKGTPGNWMSLPIGHSNFHLEWATKGSGKNKSFWVALHMEDDKRDRNYNILKELEYSKKDLSEKVDGDLIFDKWGKKWAKIEVAYPGEFSLDKASTDSKLISWAINTTVVFYEHFKESGLIGEVVKKYP